MSAQYFRQACVMPETKLDAVDGINSFKNFFKKEMGIRVLVVGEFKADKKNNILFKIHSNDMSKYNQYAQKYDLIILEDLLDNAKNNGTINMYPKQLKRYRSW
jgi:hypothetical protein